MTDFELDPRGFFVYQLWGADPDRPLYVGKSANLLTRLGEHLGNPERRPHIQRVSFTRCESAEHMNKLEVDLIWQLHPVWNVAMNGRPYSANPRPADMSAAVAAVIRLGALSTDTGS